MANRMVSILDSIPLMGTITDSSENAVFLSSMTICGEEESFLGLQHILRNNTRFT